LTVQDIHYASRDWGRARHEEREQSVSEKLSTESHPPLQVSIFSPAENGIRDELASLNLDDLRPIEALTLLHSWKDRLRRGAEETRQPRKDRLA